jgi:hypothetical protein
MDTTITTQRFRSLLRIDAAVCLASGLPVAALAGPVADQIGLESAALVRVAGGFLVVYGLALAGLARSSASTVGLVARLSAGADASCVIGTAGLVAVGILSSTGNVIVGLAAVPVAALGIAKFTVVRARASLARASA